MLNTHVFILSSLMVCGLIGGVFLSTEAGHRIGIRRRRRNEDNFPAVHPAVEGSVFGLMALLLGFSFNGAASRFENRRQLVVAEANAIGTAYLRLDLIPAEAQPEMREHFRTYVRSRLAVYREIPDVEAVSAAVNRSSVLQTRLWDEAVEALRGSAPSEKSLLLNSLNQMLDLARARTVAFTTHPPPAIFLMLGFTVIASSVLAGYSMSASEKRDWMSTITLAVVLGLAVYLILDYEFPRVGFVRLDPVDQVLADTLNGMK
jgi:hypothetical protein